MTYKGGGGGGGYSDKYVGSGHFIWVQNFEFQYFMGFFRKMNILWGYQGFVDILWFCGYFMGVITNLDYRGHFYAFFEVNRRCSRAYV